VKILRAQKSSLPAYLTEAPTIECVVPLTARKKEFFASEGEVLDAYLKSKLSLLAV
jgi:hypothetical protein